MTYVCNFSGLKLVMDLLPNHSSDKHPWFQKSILKEDPYTDYYVWAPAKGYQDGKPTAPNNWVSEIPKLR
jgi:alpha-glucosidase